MSPAQYGVIIHLLKFIMTDSRCSSGVVSLWVIPISISVKRIVPEPCMVDRRSCLPLQYYTRFWYSGWLIHMSWLQDEIFHVPQALKYCRGNFRSWDTPPGLYCLSLAYVASLFPGMWFAKAVRSLSELCSTTVLRSTNAVLPIICSILIHDLLVLLRPTIGERKATLYEIVLALYPIHWPFTFLYYKDVATLTAVLAMYLASLKRQ